MDGKRGIAKFRVAIKLFESKDLTDV